MRNRDISVIIVNSYVVRPRKVRTGDVQLQSVVHIPVIVADDQMVVRVGLKIVLERIAGVEVVAEAQDGREAVALSTKMRRRL